MVNNSGFIIHKTTTKKGRRHDYDIYNENGPISPKQVVNVFDLGYQHRKGFLIKFIHTSKKKEKPESICRRNGMQQKPF
jgi:hypothetical protein